VETVEGVEGVEERKDGGTVYGQPRTNLKHKVLYCPLPSKRPDRMKACSLVTRARSDC
jgi:hypothetical protein